MLSIRQLVKALRKLQNSSDLMKFLKQITSDTAIMNDGNNLVTSLQTTNIVTSFSQVLPKQQQQISNSSQKEQQQQQQQQQLQHQRKLNSTATVNNEASQTTVFSVVSHLDENGLISESQSTQDFSAVVSTAAPVQKIPYINCSQQIHNFYQQQLHNFHIQHNQSLYAKQKQTQFAMSSLAAEPLSLKQSPHHQDDVISLNGNNDKNDSDCCTSDERTNNQQTNSSSSSSSSSTNKPCFKSGLSEILQFMELIGNLKHTKRTGWVLRDVDDCESISGHMYRMSMMTFLLDGSEGLNQIRCMELALVHDLAESLVGDITPFCGISKEDKRAMEFKAMADICKLIEPRGKRIMELFEEYEKGESPESKFVKDLDRLDMVMQAFEYEKRDNCLLKHQEFFDSTEGKFNHPFVKKLVNEIYEQRKVLAKTKGATSPPSVGVPNNEVPRTTNCHCVATSSVRLDQSQQNSTSTSSS